LHRIAAFSVTLALVVCWAAIGGGSASAQGGTAAPGKWSSAINLQNVGNNAASATITFYDLQGTPIKQLTTASIAKNGALSLYVPTGVQDLSAGQYSAVVNSVEPFLVSVNTGSTNSASAPWTAFAYEGIGSSQAGNTLFFPGLYKSYFSFDSEMVIQNAGEATATLKADFYNAAGTKVASIANLGTVAKNAAKTISIASLSTLPSGNTNGLFGAVVTSTAGNIPLVGIGNIWRTSPTNGTASYNASSIGTSTIYAPSLLNNYYGFATALTVQNINPTQTATVVLTYSNGKSRQFALKPFASQAFYQPSDALVTGESGNVKGIFSAKVTTTGGSIVGLVSQGISFGPANGSFASYNMPGTTTPAVNISSVLHGYFGYFTAVTVQNTDPTRTTDILITYANGKSRKFTNVGPNKTVNILHLDTSGDVLTNGTATSAVVKSITSTGADNNVNLVAVLQHGTAAGVAGNDPTHVPSDYLLSVTGSPK